MVSSKRTVATIRPTYHRRQKSGALAAIIRRNGELLTRSFPPGDGLPRYVCTIANRRGRTGLFHQIMGDSRFFITADHAFGHAFGRDTSAFVAAAGGKVPGGVRHP